MEGQAHAGEQVHNSRIVVGLGHGAEGKTKDHGAMEDLDHGAIADLDRRDIVDLEHGAKAGLDHGAVADCGTMEDLGCGAVADCGTMVDLGHGTMSDPEEPGSMVEQAEQGAVAGQAEQEHGQTGRESIGKRRPLRRFCSRSCHLLGHWRRLVVRQGLWHRLVDRRGLWIAVCSPHTENGDRHYRQCSGQGKTCRAADHRDASRTR
ncbi:hypothetical protein M9458_053354 [Cirrhinus mrigala]|uniref:Uncharacterized protein n=1 Tax=Cirrhinus mrigala TaxID=683832 RepID=A0ABD0MP32_CIRMR